MMTTPLLDHDHGAALDQAAALTARPSAGLDPADRPAPTIGQAANAAAARAAVADYRRRKSANTLRTQDAALDHFSRFLAGLAGRGRAAAAAAGLDLSDLDAAAAAWAGLDNRPTSTDDNPRPLPVLASDLARWHGVTWGIVEAWRTALLQEGYSVATVNNRLSAIRVYAGLASKAGAIPVDELTLVKAVGGYGQGEGVEVDKTRPRSRRDKVKKSAAVKLAADQVARLKRAADDSGQAARDAFIMALLLDQGLRVGELAGLTVEALDLDGGRLTFYRPKVKLEQTHNLTPAALAAARRYLAARPAGAGPGLWVASNRRGGLLPRPMSERAIAARVALLGGGVEAVGLSPHDCRHNWTDAAIEGGTSDIALMDAGGWASRAMIDRYRQRAKIANEGVSLRR